MSQNYAKYPQAPPYAEHSYPPPQSYPPPDAYPPPQAYPPPDSNPPPTNVYAATIEGHGSAPKHDIPGAPEDYAGKKEERFVPTGKFQDFWAFILFYIHLAGFIAEAAILLPEMRLQDVVDINVDISRHAAAVAIGGAVSFVATIAYIFLLKAFTLTIVKLSFWLSIILFAGLAVMCVVLGSYFSAVILFAVAVIFLLTFKAFRRRMALVALLIRTVVEVANKFTGTYITSIVALICSLVHAAVFILVLIAGWLKWYDQTTGTIDGIAYVAWIYALFSFYWTQQVLKNVTHVTLGGVFAAFYFLSPSANGGSSTAAAPGMPKFPTLGAFKRSMTTSFGSVAFGSLVIALVQLVRAIINQIMYQADGPLVFLACCISCFLGCIEGLIEFFNEYAFAQVAIYGKPYCRAAKDTWRLFKLRGIDVIVTENLTGSLIFVASFFIGGLGALGAFVGGLALGLEFFDLSNTAAATGEGYWVIIVLLLALLVGAVIFGVAAGVIDSGVSTTFVCLAEEPEALYRTKPEVYEAIKQAFPSIVVPVNRGYA